MASIALHAQNLHYPEVRFPLVCSAQYGFFLRKNSSQQLFVCLFDRPSNLLPSPPAQNFIKKNSTFVLIVLKVCFSKCNTSIRSALTVWQILRFYLLSWCPGRHHHIKTNIFLFLKILVRILFNAYFRMCFLLWNCCSGYISSCLSINK